MTDLTRTSRAIDAYDEFDKLCGDDEDFLDHLAELEKAVGHAYGLDTTNINDPKTCALLRVGPRAPQPGFEPSFVRLMVASWKEKK